MFLLGKGKPVETDTSMMLMILVLKDFAAHISCEKRDSGIEQKEEK